MPRKSNMTSPTSIEVILIPDPERVAQAQALAAPGYRRAFLRKLKQQADRASTTKAGVLTQPGGQAGSAMKGGEE